MGLCGLDRLPMQPRRLGHRHASTDPTAPLLMPDCMLGWRALLCAAASVTSITTAGATAFTAALAPTIAAALAAAPFAAATVTAAANAAVAASLSAAPVTHHLQQYPTSMYDVLRICGVL